MNHNLKIIISTYDLITKLEGDLNDLILELNSIKKHYKSIANYWQGDDIFRVRNIFGTEFSFLVTQDKYMENDIYVLSVWDYTGNTLVFAGKIPDKNRVSFIRSFEKAIDNYSNGIIKCGECKKDISYQQNRSHRHFAAIYCDNCWNSKWKAIEEKENYN